MASIIEIQIKNIITYMLYQKSQVAKMDGLCVIEVKSILQQENLKIQM